MIESLIRQNNSAGRPTVLGLPTGSTPVGLYRELIRLHREAGLDFSRVITFNLDEYFPMQPDDPQSYRRWMQETFFNHVNIPPQNIHVPDGTIKPEEVEDYCHRYEQKIRRAGGIDLQILGIGRTGHIGFNEPGSTRHSRTRMVTLDPVTRRDAASSFFGEENVPHQALTMGVGTILDARKIVLMAFGEHKARIVQRAVEGAVTDAVAASFLQQHPDATFLLDQAAAGESDRLRAALGRRPGQLDAGPDPQGGHLAEPQGRQGPAQAVRRRFPRTRAVRAAPRTRPGQRPGPARLRRADGHALHAARRAGSPAPSSSSARTPTTTSSAWAARSSAWSSRAHRVHVAYMTSGNIAVFDHDAWRFTDFVVEFNRLFRIDEEQTEASSSACRRFLRSKKPGQPDSRGFAQGQGADPRDRGAGGGAGLRHSARATGVHGPAFLPHRHHRQGADPSAGHRRHRRPAGTLAAGTDLRGRRTVRSARHASGLRRGDLRGRARRSRKKGQKFEVWLYRGAWEEWEPHEIERVVPLSPEDVERKKQAIFRHQSQKDRAMFPGGTDRREFWQRAEDRNRNTAQVYDQLGLPEFYALEGFVQWRDADET